MSHSHIVASSETAFFVWHYRTTSRLTSELTHISTKKGREAQDRLIHIDDSPSDTSDVSVDFSKAMTVREREEGGREGGREMIEIVS